MATDTTKITGAADDLSDKLTKGGSAAKTLGAEIANAINSLDSRIAAIEAGGGGGTVPPTSSAAMTETIKQNTVGQSEAFPLGVPHSYDWYTGKTGPLPNPPPAGWVCVTMWGQVYPEEGQTVQAGNIKISNTQCWVHLKAGGWVKVQDQINDGLDGAHYPANFQGSTIEWNQVNNADKSVTGPAPPQGYNVHFYPGRRGSFTVNTVDGCYTQCDIQTLNNMRMVVNIGADWWESMNASMGVNPGVGMNNWIKLSSNVRRSYFASFTEAQLKADPPPPLR